MFFILSNPDRLFDRTWRPRHPLRPKTSGLRKGGMFCLLILLTTVILGYTWLTDSRRVRSMASAYLSDLLGGEVEIGNANLSIFEGLRLDNVTLRVDAANKPDSTIFHAQTLTISYNPAELLAGRLAATKIIAIDPTVTLVEDPQTHGWNYQRLWQGNGPGGRGGGNGGPSNLVLPQIYLRDAQVAYMQMQDGIPHPMGWYNLECQFTPAGPDSDSYDFQMQSRGREALGPSVNGTVNLRGGQSVIQLSNLMFGPDVRTMLMNEPRAWCESHALKGRVNIPEMVYTPGKNGQKPSFHSEIVVSDVEMLIHPQEWMSREQNERVEWFHGLLDTAESKHWISQGAIDAMRRLSTPQPVNLRQVSGTFVFSEDHIELKGISGKLENNWFKIDGKIDGYSPDAAASLTVGSLPGHDLEIPAGSPNYIGSLPPEVQEIYEQLHPQGTCSVSVQLDRKTAGGKPRISGRIDIHEGNFCFSDFPYPLSRVKGTILIGPDSFTHMDGIRISNVKGYGIPGGPNANSFVLVDGFIGPLDQVAGVALDIRGKDISTEPAVRAALPPPVEKAMRLFDPTGRGDTPTFHGDFTCRVNRAIGPHQPVAIDVDLNLDHGNATLAVFPYPMRDMTGRLEIRQGQLNIVAAQMRHGDSSLTVDGKVTWRTSATTDLSGPFGPDLKIQARNIPLNDELRNALPVLQRTWLKKSGASGLVDMDGHVFAATPGPANSPTAGREIDYAFDLTLHDGGLWPQSGTFALSGLTAQMKLTPDRLVLSDLSAHRGEAVVRASGAIDWAGDQPGISLTAEASNLLLDTSLFNMLPAGAQAGWQSVNPQGTVDATMSYQSDKPLELKIRPRDLAITPEPFPYRMEKISGLVTITPDKVVLENIQGRHGDTEVHFSGQGDLGDHPQWNLTLGAGNLAVDNEFLKAVPSSLNQVLKSLNVRGKTSIEFSKFSYRPVHSSPASSRDNHPNQSTESAAIPAASRQTASTPGQASTRDDETADVDFAAKIILKDASMDIGIPASEVNGSIDLAGLIRNGSLSRLAGQMSADSLILSNRPAAHFKGTLAKSGDDPLIQLTHIECQLAGGDVAGEGQFTYLDTGPGNYDLNLVLRDADVQKLTMPKDKTIKGTLTASLEVGGTWNRPASRRGHGDVRIHGADMYEVPMVLGLVQIANLALPLTSPFSEATAGYSIDGQKIKLERIDLKSNDMTMSGSGTLDFDTKSVSLWLATENPALVAVPIVGPLLGGVKQELLRIHVNGTILEPKISATSFDTITTTVDQVLKGDDKK